MSKNESKRLYKLFYRVGRQKPTEIMFEFGGDRKNAVERGRNHCERMGFLFIWCEPAIYDLDDREARRAESEELSETIR